jgi:hypothetical protein
MRRHLSLLVALAFLLLAAVAIAGCGGGDQAKVCPAATNGHGSPGICAPKNVKLKLALPTVEAGPRYQDRSNNNPCYCGALIRNEGYRGLIAKSNQGGFIDQTAAGMIASARAAGLAVGLYDFDQNYTIAEAQLFVSRARAAGITPTGRNEFPLYFDVESGAFSLPGLRAQIAYVRSQGYRVGEYTGNWYWGPHAGCAWTGVSAWLSGYPNAIIPCGLSLSLYLAHQFSDNPVDVTVYRGSLAQFEAFVNNLAPPKPHLICFGPRAQLHNRTCERARPELAKLSRARSASQHALTRVDRGLSAHGCRKPYRRRVCVQGGRSARVLSQRVRYFTGRADVLFRAYT